jgi:hypothetical protein
MHLVNPRRTTPSFILAAFTEDCAMRRLLSALLVVASSGAQAADWVEVGADTEAKYYVDVSSIEVQGDTVRVQKKGIYTQPLTENFGGSPRVFKETLGWVELDCGRRINRVVQIDMLGPDGNVVWSSGRMPKRDWEDVRPNTHGEATLQFVCGKLKKT